MHTRDLRCWLKPERLEGTEGVKDGHKMMPFGLGRRRCSGGGPGSQDDRSDSRSADPVLRMGTGREGVGGNGRGTQWACPLMARCSPGQSMRLLLLLSQIHEFQMFS